jgi:hypothetical protein
VWWSHRRSLDAQHVETLGTETQWCRHKKYPANSLTTYKRHNLVILGACLVFHRCGSKIGGVMDQ